MRRIDINEELSGEFVASVEIENDDATAEPADLLGASATLTMARAGAAIPPRRFSGIVRAVEEAVEEDAFGRRICRVVIEPAFACLKEQVRTKKLAAGQGCKTAQHLRKTSTADPHESSREPESTRVPSEPLGPR